MRHPLPISVLIRHTYSTVGRVLIFSGGPLGVNHGLLNPAHGSILPPLLAIIYSAPIRPSLSGGNKQRHVKKKLFKEIFPPQSFLCDESPSKECNQVGGGEELVT